MYGFPFHAYTYVAFLWHADGRNLPQVFLSLQDALKFTLIKLTITRNSPYSSLDFEACLGFQNIEDAKIACGDMCHPREKWSQHLSSNLTEVHKFIEEGDDGQEEMCKAV